jgi:hypothetical protein
MRRNIPCADALIAIAAASVATLSSAKVFDAWGQVTVLWEAGLSPLTLIGHAHMLRYMIAYPGFLLEESWPGTGFSLYVGIFFGLNVLLLRLITQLVAARRPSLGVYSLFIGTHLAMNGRGVIAWAGWLLCVWICLRISAGQARPGGQIGWIALSLWLAAVTSGVFVVVVLSLVVFIVLHRRAAWRSSPLSSVAAVVMGAPVVWLAWNYLLVVTQKNLEFFGGESFGLIYMASHGMGKIILDSGPLAILLLGAIGFTGIQVLLTYRLHITPLDRLICLATVGGLFGFTVLTLAIPLLLVRSLVRERRVPLGLPRARGSV